MKVSKELAVHRSEDEFAQKLQVLMDSGAGVIQIRATEVTRATYATRKAVLVDGHSYNEWNIVDGNRNFDISNMLKVDVKGDNNTDIEAALAQAGAAIASHASDSNYTVYCLINPHYWIDNNPPLIHHLEQYCHILPSTNIRVLLVTPDIPMPESIAGSIVTVRFGTPSFAELRGYLDGITGGLEEGVLDMQEEEADRLCATAAGMTREGFETYTSLAIVDSVKEDGTVTFQSVLDGVSKGKTEIVKQNDLLELFPAESMKDVGGMQTLKEWVSKRVGCYTDEAADMGVEPPKGLVLVGVPGCLAGDTVVDYRRGARSGSRTITLEEMYKKFNGISTSTRSWDTTMPTFLHSWFPDDTIAYNRVISVIESGEKELVEIVMETGEVLHLTEDHPVAHTSGQFLTYAELCVGDKLLLRGSMRPVNKGGRRLDMRPPRRIINLKHHPYGSKKEVDYYQYTGVAYARLVVEAHMNDIEVDEFIHALKHNAAMSSTFKYLDPEYEVHHVDEDTMNDDLDNLMVYTKQEHARVHGFNENFNVQYLRKVPIKSMRKLPGKHMTYDVQMDLPANNFVAGGIIVHNTGKSLAAKAVASEFGVPLIRLDFGRVFNSLVGSSEERMRRALRMVESMAPVVLLCDEIDKGLGGINGGGGDAGTSSRVLGSFLTWLQENKTPVFTMVTANNITGLPPELLRRGRLDGIFSTGLPNDGEKLEVLNIHLAKRGYNPKDFPLVKRKKLVKFAKGYVPAEIEAAVKDGLVDAFAAGEKFTIDHIGTALSRMIPLSHSYAVEIQKMTLWMKQNTISASPEYVDTDDFVEEEDTKTTRRLKVVPKDKED